LIHLLKTKENNNMAKQKPDITPVVVVHSCATTIMVSPIPEYKLPTIYLDIEPSRRDENDESLYGSAGIILNEYSAKSLIASIEWALAQYKSVKRAKRKVSKNETTKK
jgi:hypothetical protein